MTIDLYGFTVMYNMPATIRHEKRPQFTLLLEPAALPKVGEIEWESREREKRDREHPRDREQTNQIIGQAAIHVVATPQDDRVTENGACLRDREKAGQNKYKMIQ